MNSTVLAIARKLRAEIKRKVRPADRSGLFLGGRKLAPLSSRQGFDRGTPIDRYYIEMFLEQNSEYIRGRCLEIGDNRYTRKLGGKKVSESDVLDIDPQNRKATIRGDIANLANVKSNSFDCVIVTQVLGLVPEFEKAVAEIYRILKPNGCVLFTGSYFSRTLDPTSAYVRFTPNGCRYLFGKHFGENQLSVRSFGNCLVGQAAWIGMSKEELTKDELEFNDPHFPCLVAVRAIKKASNIPTVTVGVAAYNEAGNIENFLKSVISQKETGFKISKILIISDGSTDETVLKARAIRDPRIEVKDYGTRLGHSARLSQIYRNLRTDFLVKSDADVTFASVDTIANLLVPLTADLRIGLVSGRAEPYGAKTFMERAIHTTKEAYEEVRKVRDGDNKFSVQGRIMALRRELARKITIPGEVVGNDAYTYFACKTKGFGYSHVPNARVFYRSPQKIKDHIRQNTRFLSAPLKMRKYFNTVLVEKEYSVPKSLLIKGIAKQLFRHPLETIFIFFVNRYCSILARRNYLSITGRWQISSSTKT